MKTRSILPPRPLRVDRRFSAKLTFQAWKKFIGARQAYFLAVARYGWTEAARAAAVSRLLPSNRAILSLP